MINVTIFNEFLHEKESPIKEIYPNGIHAVIKSGIENDEISVKTVTLDDCEEQLTEENLKNTDVIIWWGHIGHNSVPDIVAERVVNAVHEGMGAIFLHSAHHSKPFKRLLGTSCNLTWREDGDRELLWVINPAHPIAEGIDRFINIEHEETYGEPFCIPEPDELVFIGNFEGGEVMRAGCCFRRENGKIFYFQPGHESFPVYYHPEIIKVIKNAVMWAKPTYRKKLECPHVEKPLAK